MPDINLDLTFHTANATTQRKIVINQAIIAGWTGRDPAAVAKHVAELAELGVTPPATTPIFYRVTPARFTTSSHIEATGGASSGEVEFVLLRIDGTTWVGVGSDHTDRQVETYSVTVSKQMCEKPIATEFWALHDVIAHWDQLILRSFCTEGGETRLYQEGPVASMIDPEGLVARFTGGGPLPDGAVMMCGTLAAKGGIRPAERFAFEIEDPVLKRMIKHEYRISCLPEMG